MKLLHALKNLRMSTRITLAALFLVVAGGMTLMFVENLRLREVYLSELGSDLKQRFQLEDIRLNQATKTLCQDVLFLSNIPPVSGIMRAVQNRGFDSRDGDTHARWAGRLNGIFSAFSTAHPDYYQIRYIGVADGGRELGRIDNRNGQVETTPPARLMTRGDQDYFKVALALHPGQVWLSEFILNRDRDGPPVRTLRAATPVFTASGEVFGVVMIDMDAGNLLESAALGLPKHVRAYISNMAGQYLLHPDPRQALGFEQRGKNDIAMDFPALATMTAPQAANELPLQSVATRNGQQLLAAKRIAFDAEHPERFVLLSYGIPDTTAELNMVAIPVENIFGGFAIMLLLGVGTQLMLRRTLSPILMGRNRALMRNSMDGIHVLDIHGNVVASNDAFCRMLGYTKKEMAGLNVADWAVRFSEEQLRARFLDHIGKSEMIETVHRCKDGRLIDVEISITGAVIDGQKFIFATSRDISERKKTDAMLRRHKQVIDAAIDGFWMTDLQGNLLEANEAYVKMSGYSTDELLHMHISQLEALEQLPEQVHEHIEKIIAQGYDRFETRHRHKDGHEIDIEVSANYMAESQCLFVFSRDITKRKKADEALRVAAVVFETNEAIMITDVGAKIIRVNQAFTEITGYSAGEVLGKNPNMMSSGRHDKDFYTGMWQQLLHKGSWTGEIWDKRKNGQIYPKWTTITAVKNDRHEITQYVAVFSDITSYKQAGEEILMESEERFRGTLEQAAVGILHVALDGSFQRINEKFCEIVGYSHDELIRLGFREITFPEDFDKDVVCMRQMLAGEITTFAIEKRFIRKDQTLVWVNLTVSMLRKNDASPNFLIFVIEDISERKRAELDLGESRQMLRELVAQGETVREEERKCIAREIHDELGQILTALRMDVSLLRLQFGVRDPVLLEKAQGMTVLLDRAIQGVRNVASNLRPTALDMGLVSAIEWLGDEFSEHTRVTCVVHQAEEHIELDETHAVVVFRIVQESLTNITRHAGASRVDITLALHAGILHVSVSDNGKGFDPMNITNRKSFGLLGMRERAMALGGTVEIASTLRQGTVVSVRMPIN